MKKYILTFLAITALFEAEAQPVIYPRDGRLDGYYYSFWYDECCWYSDTCSMYEIRGSSPIFQDIGPWQLYWPIAGWDTIDQPMKNIAKGDYTEYPMAITGLGVWQARPQDYRVDLPLGEKNGLPEYIYIMQYTTDSLIILDSARWDTAAPKLMMLPKNRDSLGQTDTNGYRQCVRGYFQVLLYEVNLPTPIVVDSCFYLVGTMYSNKVDQTTHRYITNSPTRYLMMRETSANFECGYQPCPSQLYHFSSGYFRTWYTPKQYGAILVKVTDFVNLDLRVNDPQMGSVETPSQRSRNTYQTFTAVPNYGYRFCCWDDGDTSNPRQIYLTQDTLFTALFFPIGFNRVVVTSNGEDFGQVSGGGVFETGDSTIISATPNYGYRFSSWDDGDTNNPRKVYVSHDTTFTAIFNYIGIYSVTLRGSDSIFVKVYGDGIFEGGDSALIRARFVPHNSELDTTSHYWMAFSTWDDGVVANPRTICVTQDTLITAIYEITSIYGISNPDEATRLFTLTPNPATGTVTVTVGHTPQSLRDSSPNLGEQFSLTLTDAAGREVMRKELSTLMNVSPDTGSQFSIPIDISGLPAGTYFVTLSTPAASGTQRLVVK